ncbi:MAG TPA: acetate--CoA ligase family protein [Kofleriaceae bacterium]|jgi:acetyltransferase|nr:acetate--CoA ligase family protein [Kofleriaceae bacterium]
MAQARSIASVPAAIRVQVIAPAHLGTTALAALRVRGIDARIADAPIDLRASRAANDSRTDRLDEAFGDDVIAWALDAAPGAALAAELAAVCARVAAAGRPVCLLAPLPRGEGRAAIERAAALAYLRAYGAAVGHDVDAWLESIVLLVRFGLPAGPRTAVIAPPGSWLEAQSVAIAAEAELGGMRSPLSAPDDPTDVVLYDPALGAPPSTTPGLTLPVAARGELAGGTPILYNARAALGAIATLGRAAERIAVGLGPAPTTASAELAIDHDKLARQLAKLGSEQRRLGDHETKVLLSAYGVPITRQAVATTPSAAVKLARRAGYPVEIKPFGHDLPSEPAGCPVEHNLSSDAMVRAAFTTVLLAAGRRPDEGTGVIIRETPPAGRDLSVSFLELPSLGWTVVLAPGAGGQLAAAPAPLRLIDAQSLAAQVAASRAGDPAPDRSGLADLLRRASHLVVDLGDRLARLELPRVVVGGRGARTLVVDALTELG